ncbi:PREDICTED: uncharacterized protein LOC109158121 isoform X2 [Ipomoea nil]|uniref:uncharacterized protein LOC109158121 isoform X2 n=1 Tax=Ipomoea nil TaxID=35883 RepID=UPI0009019B6D|nr:PREDICTED: uncharacterized protein LOC109158121 isoform X2 [Ipomoea nil]
MAAAQENGWPLGLRHPHNLRIRRFNGSIVSFDTAASPTSTSGFSSDLDTQYHARKSHGNLQLGRAVQKIVNEEDKTTFEKRK